VTQSKHHAVVKISKIVRGAQDLTIRNKLCRWRDFVELRQYQHEALDAVLTRHNRREKRHAYVKWLATVKGEQMSVRYENLSTLVTEMSYKQRVFLALRHACQQQRSERINEKFHQWKQRCLAARNRKYYVHKKLMIERL
jgi:nuclear transport factor 2 (NTF2) superfamily protein